MRITGIKYIAPILDGSGYAQAARGNVVALHKAGVPVMVNPISFEHARPSLGKDGDIIQGCINNPVDYNVVLIHTTPEFWSQHREEGKLNVGYTIWETTKIHPDWKRYINDNVDLCIVGCEWNVGVFKDSGVTVPVKSVPHYVDAGVFDTAEPYNIQGLPPDHFAFYSIFQWQERKNPMGLIKAYWHAFTENEKVALILKTYRSNYSEQEKNAVRQSLQRLKYMFPYESYPKIYLIPDMLTNDEILSLHKRGDCYVTLDRGEGFGLSTATAAACGNPIISTGFGGVREYADEDNSYLVNYTLTPVGGLPWCPWYLGEQLWAEPDVKHASDTMRRVYENREEAEQRGAKIREHVKNNLSHEVIGNKLIKNIEELL